VRGEPRGHDLGVLRATHAHRDGVSGSDEAGDLPGLDIRGVVHPLEHLEQDEEGVLPDLDLGTLLAGRGVLEQQGLEVEGLRHEIDLGAGGIRQGNPREVGGIGHRVTHDLEVASLREVVGRDDTGVPASTPVEPHDPDHVSPPIAAAVGRVVRYRRGMPLVILVRHGRTQANASGILAGWTPGVHLDDQGIVQVGTAAERLRPLSLSAIVTSPLERTVQTAEALDAAQRKPPGVQLDERLGECRYGTWTNRPLAELAKTPLWRTVQERPSAVTFPEGESLPAMQARALAAVHEWNDRLGDKATYAMVSHGDVIKAIVADALGVHLDQFQRIVVDPASVSVIRYGARGVQVLHVNDRGSDLTPLARTKPRKRVEGAVGGGSGEH